MLARIILLAALALSIILPSLAETYAISFASVTVFEPSVLYSNAGKVVVGQQAVVSVMIRNDLDVEWPMTEIIEIRDSSDVTAYMALQSISLQPAGNYTFGSSWTPEYADTYHVRTFAITELANPQILSAVKTHDVLVFENESQNAITFSKPHLNQSFLIHNDSILENYSVNPQIELQYYIDEPTRSFVISAHNPGYNDTEMILDKWGVSRSYGDSSGSGEITDAPERRIFVPANSWILLKTIDFASDSHDFEINPQTYNIELVGYTSHNGSGDRADYKLGVKIVYEYNAELLKSLGVNKLLEANDMVLVINGTFADGQPFVIDGDSPKRIDIYITNNEAGKISAIRSGDSFGIWPLSNRNLEESSGSVADYFGKECYYLKPGESIRATSIMLSKTEWPLDDIKLSHKELPGLYVLYYSAYTRPCTLEDGERVPAMNPTLIAVFEVK